MSAWIKMRVDLHTDPRVVRIQCALRAAGVSMSCSSSAMRCAIIGALHRVWSIADTHTEDGVLTGYSLEVIDDLVGIDGFASAMMSIGWLADGPKGLWVPDFDKHNGQSAKRRATHAQQMAVRRSTSQDAHAERTPSGPRKEKEKEKETRQGEEASATREPMVQEFGSVTRPRGISLAEWVSLWHGRGRASPVFVEAATAFWRSRDEAGKPITRSGAAALLTPCDGFTDDEVIADMQRCVAGGFVRLEPRKANAQRATGPSAINVNQHTQAALQRVMERSKGQ
jgi:hypothetical protein